MPRPRRTSWERVREGNGLKPLKHKTRPAPEDQIALYLKTMGPAHDVDLTNPEARFIVRLWDGMDGCWCDCTAPVSARKALEVWMERTKNGTERVNFNQIDYYRIYPADTRMHWSGDREMFR